MFYNFKNVCLYYICFNWCERLNEMEKNTGVIDTLNEILNYVINKGVKKYPKTSLAILIHLIPILGLFLGTFVFTMHVLHDWFYFKKWQHNIK